MSFENGPQCVPSHPAKTNLQDHARLCKNLARILHASLAHDMSLFLHDSCTILHQFLQDLAKNVQEMQVIILAASLAKSCTISCKVCARLCKNRARKGTYHVQVLHAKFLQDSCMILQVRFCWAWLWACCAQCAHSNGPQCVPSHDTAPLDMLCSVCTQQWPPMCPFPWHCSSGHGVLGVHTAMAPNVSLLMTLLLWTCCARCAHSNGPQCVPSHDTAPLDMLCSVHVHTAMAPNVSLPMTLLPWTCCARCAHSNGPQCVPSHDTAPLDMLCSVCTQQWPPMCPFP